MPDISPLAVAVATLAAFMTGGAYYALFGAQLAAAGGAAAEADQPPAPWTYAAEAGRCLLIALVVAGLVEQTGTDDAVGGLLLGLALWVGFPLVLWIGAVVHERTPVRLAALHAGGLAGKAATGGRRGGGPAVGLLHQPRETRS